MEDERKEALGMRVLKWLGRHWKAVLLVLITAVITAGITYGICEISSNAKIAQLALSGNIDEPEGIEVVAEPVSIGAVVSVLEDDMQALGELVTVEYLYTDAGSFSNSNQLFGHNVPFTEKSFMLRWEGVIKAGIDITELKIDIDEEAKTITVTMPEAYIVSNEIDYDSVETLSEKDGLFNNVTIDDSNSVIKESLEYMEERAIKQGLFETAIENAEVLINQILSYDERLAEYEIEYVSLEEASEEATE